MKNKLFYLALLALLGFNLALAQKAIRPVDQEYWQKALALVQNGRLDEALENFKKALPQKPDPETIGQAARILKQSGGNDQTEAIYLWGREITDREDVFSLELAELYQVKLKYPEAVKELARMIKTQPATAQKKFDELGIQAGYPAIAQLAEKYLDMKDDESLWLMGELCRKSGDGRLAWKYFRNLKNEKRLGIALNQLINTPQMENRTARYVLEEYLQNQRPDRIRWELKLADIYFNAGNIKQAENILNDLSERKNPAAQLKLAELLLRKKQRPEESAMLIDANSPSWPDSLKRRGEFFMAECLMAMGKWAQAESLCEKLAEQNRSLADKQQALYFGGEINLANNRIDEALKKYGQAAKIDQEGIYANDALSRILLISRAKTDKIDRLELLSRAMARKYLLDYGQAKSLFLVLSDSAFGTGLGDLAFKELSDLEAAFGRYKQAAEYLQNLAGTTGDSLTAAGAIYQTGLYYRYRLDDRKTAAEQWRQGILKYPNTSWAEMMRQEIELIEKRQ